MKKLFLMALLAICVDSQVAFSSPEMGIIKKLGLGLESDLTLTPLIGISAKYYLQTDIALQSSVKINAHQWNIHVDGLKQFDTLVEGRTLSLQWYGGGGLTSTFGSGAWDVGVEGVLGSALLFSEAPVDVCAEYAPEVIYGTVGLWGELLRFRVMMRYYFF